MNSFQVVVVLRSDAGGMAWRFRMLPTGRCLTGVDVLYSEPSLNPILPNTIECDHDSPSPALSPLPRDRYCPSWPDSAREATVPLPRATLCQSYLSPKFQDKTVFI